MKIKNFIIIFVVVFGVLIAGGSYAWVLAAPPTRELPVASVTVTGGEAWIQKSGNGDWSPVGSETAVALGDRVKTGSNGGAEIDFFDSSVARLDHDSETVIRDLAVDPNDAASQRVTVGLVAGRVWSRVLKFLDQDSSYSVESSDVVATVRGTAFAVDATSPTGVTVDVVESNVAVSIVGSGEEMSTGPGEEAFVARETVASGTIAAVRAPRRVIRRKTDQKIQSDAWFVQMQRDDEAWPSSLKERQVKTLRRQAGILPGSPFYGLKLLGERLRTALVSDPMKRRDLALLYADRRFAEISVLGLDGRQEIAKRMLQGFHRRYVAVLADIENKRLSETDTAALCLVVRGRFLEQDLALRALGDGDLATLVTRLDNPPADLKVLPRALRDRLCSGVKQVPEFRPILPTIVPVLNATSSLDAATSTHPSTQANTNVNLSVTPVANVNAPVTNINTNANVNAPVAAVKVTRVAVTGQRTMLYLPDTQQMRAVAYLSDGTTKDVTVSASWSSTDPNVFMAGGGLVNTVGIGSASVIAGFEGLTGSFAIRVLGANPALTVSLQSLSVSCSPSTLSRYLTAGSSSTCSATAHYSDGSTKSVTAAASWSVSGGVGSMTANVFYPGQTPGTATVTASYADDTGSAKGTASVTVM